MVTCWERADILSLFGDVYCIFVTFPCGILGQVWYLIVSFPDLCLLSYFKNVGTNLKRDILLLFLWKNFVNFLLTVVNISIMPTSVR